VIHKAGNVGVDLACETKVHRLGSYEFLIELMVGQREQAKRHFGE
jgi:hypothetical protein